MEEKTFNFSLCYQSDGNPVNDRCIISTRDVELTYFMSVCEEVNSLSNVAGSLDNYVVWVNLSCNGMLIGSLKFSVADFIKKIDYLPF